MEKHLKAHEDIWTAYLKKKTEEAQKETSKPARKRPLDSNQPKFTFEPQTPKKLNPSVLVYLFIRLKHENL
jgi:hypothetical protein